MRPFQVATVFAIAVAGSSGCDRMVNQPRQTIYSMSAAAQPADTMEFEAQSTPVPRLSRMLLQRGRDRYHIFCAPCHSELGDGRGMVVQRGFPAPPSFSSERVRALSPQQLFEVISKGFGIMYSFDDRVPPEDRWAIVAYLHALQLSAHGDEGK